MKKLLFALTILIMVTIPAALAGTADVPFEKHTKASPSSVLAAATDFNGTTIDIAVEGTAPTVSGATGYSIDNKNWSATLSDANWKKLLDKGGVLYVVKNTDGTKTGAPDNAGGYVIGQFRSITARPKAPKLKPWYLTDGTWTICKDSQTLTNVVAAGDYGKYEMAAAKADGKTPDGAYATFAPVNVLGSASTTKPAYLIRTPASVDTQNNKYVPASKDAKIKPAKAGKKPSAKIDYKKEIIKLKKGTYATSSSISTPWGATDKVVEVDASTVIGADAKMAVWVAATGKKPASEPFEFDVAGRATTPTATTIGIDNGKFAKDTTKPLEMKGATKWGAVKAPASSGTIIVRVKANVKMNKDGTIKEGLAASTSATLTVTVSALDTSDPNSKQGVTLIA